MHAVRCSVGVAEGQSRVWTGQHKVTLLQDRAPLGFKPLLRKLQQSLCISALLLPLKTSQTDAVVDNNRWINQRAIQIIFHIVDGNNHTVSWFLSQNGGRYAIMRLLLPRLKS